jgi:hypothetical protein
LLPEQWEWQTPLTEKTEMKNVSNHYLIRSKQRKQRKIKINFRDGYGKFFQVSI